LNISGAFAVNAAGLSSRFGAGAFGAAAAGFGVVVAGAAGFGAGLGVDVCAAAVAAVRTNDVRTISEKRIVFLLLRNLHRRGHRGHREKLFTAEDKEERRI